MLSGKQNKTGKGDDKSKKEIIVGKLVFIKTVTNIKNTELEALLYVFSESG